MKDVPSGLRDEEPHGDGERQAQAGKEPAGLETPVPFMGVDHIGNQEANGDSDKARRCGSEARGIGTESLRRNLADEAPSSGCIGNQAQICAPSVRLLPQFLVRREGLVNLLQIQVNSTKT